MQSDSDVFIRAFADRERATLLFAAVLDSQGTIRAVDTKVGILLAALAIPLPYVLQALSAERSTAYHFSFDVLCGWLAAAAYVIAGFVAIRALTGTGDAGAKLTRANRPPDVFYLGGLYRFGLIDAAINRRGMTARRDLEEIVAAIHTETVDILRVLANELMTLAYIRDVKLHRQRIAFELTAIALILALLTMLL